MAVLYGVGVGSGDPDLRDEELHVIPSAYSIGRAMELPGTKVFMKAGKRLTEIKNAVDESNQSIYFVENLGIEDEHIIEGVENIPDTAGYYSMVIVKEGK